MAVGQRRFWATVSGTQHIKAGTDPSPFVDSKYSRKSVARTLMARLPRLFRTRSSVPRKNRTDVDLG